MLNRSVLRRIALGVVFAMMFAQAALAAAACDWVEAAPAQAIAASSGEPSCHDKPARNTNLCLSHCLSTDQAAGVAKVTVPGLVAPVFELPTLPDVLATSAARLRHDLPHVAAPPPRILFQSFLI